MGLSIKLKAASRSLYPPCRLCGTTDPKEFYLWGGKRHGRKCAACTNLLRRLHRLEKRRQREAARKVALSVRVTRWVIPKDWYVAVVQEKLRYLAHVVDLCGGNLTLAEKTLKMTKQQMALRREAWLIFLRRKSELRPFGPPYKGAQYRARRHRWDNTRPVHHRQLAKCESLAIHMARWKLTRIERAVAVHGSLVAAARYMGLPARGDSSTTLGHHRATARRVLERAGVSVRSVVKGPGIKTWLSALLEEKVNGCDPYSPEMQQRAKQVYRRRVLELHTDRGGAHAEIAALNVLWDRISKAYEQRTPNPVIGVTAWFAQQAEKKKEREASREAAQ